MRSRIFLGVLVVSLLAAPAALSAQTLPGTWTGLGLQADAAGQPHTWTIRLTLNADGSAKIDYPSLNCGGTLTRLRGSGDLVEYRESLTYGTDKCLDRGTVGILPRASEVIWYWTGENTSQPASAATAVLRSAR